MPKMVVLSDVFRWHETDPVTHKTDHFTGYQGEEHDIPEEHVARAEKLGEEHGRPFLGTPDDLDTLRAAGEIAPEPPPELPVRAGRASDEDLARMTAAQLTSYVSLFNDETGRVVDLEKARSRPRQSVLALDDRVADAQQVGADAQAARERAASETLADRLAAEQAAQAEQSPQTVRTGQAAPYSTTSRAMPPF